MNDDFDPTPFSTRRKMTPLEMDFSSLSDSLMEKIDAISIKYNGSDSDVHEAIRAWFGSDTLDAYLDWLSESDF